MSKQLIVIKTDSHESIMSFERFCDEAEHVWLEGDQFDYDSPTCAEHGTVRSLATIAA